MLKGIVVSTVWGSQHDHTIHTHLNGGRSGFVLEIFSGTQMPLPKRIGHGRLVRRFYTSSITLVKTVSGDLQSHPGRSSSGVRQCTLGLD